MALLGALKKDETDIDASEEVRLKVDGAASEPTLMDCLVASEFAVGMDGGDMEPLPYAAV